MIVVQHPHGINTLGTSKVTLLPIDPPKIDTALLVRMMKKREIFRQISAKQNVLQKKEMFREINAQNLLQEKKDGVSIR